jgi:hypothetical protein
MYWLLLPVDANAQRQFVAETGRLNEFWIHLWASLSRSAFGGVKTPDA